jgi:hypothetical protein
MQPGGAGRARAFTAHALRALRGRAARRHGGPVRNPPALRTRPTLWTTGARRRAGASRSPPGEPDPARHVLDDVKDRGHPPRPVPGLKTTSSVPATSTSSEAPGQREHPVLRFRGLNRSAVPRSRRRVRPPGAVQILLPVDDSRLQDPDGADVLVDPGSANLTLPAGCGGRPGGHPAAGRLASTAARPRQLQPGETEIGLRRKLAALLDGASADLSSTPTSRRRATSCWGRRSGSTEETRGP